MKKLFLTLVVIAMTAAGSSLFAQAKKVNPTNCYFVRFGEMLVMKEGQISRLDSDQTLPDGTIIYNNGSIKKPGAQPVFLSEGQKADLNGNIKTEPVQTEVTMKNGQLVMITEGVEEVVTHDLKLLNGNAILMDGTVYSPSAGQVRMTNGERYDLDGNKKSK